MDWDEREALLDEALDQPREAREHWIRARTAGDERACAELLALVRAVDRTSPLDAGVADVAPNLLATVTHGNRQTAGLEASELGAYRIDRLIGEGGMAEVYAARRSDGAFERTVAVKVLRLGLTGDEARARFARERQILASLSHPNIARLYDGGLTDRGRPYLVMEWIDGAPITDHCRCHGLDQVARLTLFLGVLEGVEHAHRRGIVHRDLKPSNLLVEHRGDGPPRAVVLDFGIARDAAAPALTLTGQTLGTPGYMAPEQVRGTLPADARGAAGAGHIGDPRSDVFSLGTVLFELIYDRPVYDAGSTAQVLAQALDAKIEWPEEPALDRDLETIMMVALARDPRDRYASVGHFASDVAAYLAGHPIAMRRPGPVERGLRLIRRQPKLVASLAMIAVLVVGLIGANVRARWQAQADARAARALGQAIESVDARLRLGHLLPRHDIRPARARVAATVDGFEARLADLPGPAHYAVGRGALALRQLDRAREHLEAAWTIDDQRPEVALTLGRAYADLYEREARAARKIRDEDERLARLAALDAELRRPAIARLTVGREAAILAGVGTPIFVEGLLAYQDEDFVASAAAARRAAAEAPWLYEALALEARALAAQGDASATRGDHENAASAYEQALVVYARALTIGRSDPTLYLGRCTTLNRTLDLARETGDLAPAVFERVASQCAEGLDIDPDAYDLAWSIARVHWQRGVYLRTRGEDPEAAWVDLITYAERALAIEPLAYQAANLKGLAWMYRGAEALEAGRLAGAVDALDEATAAFERTLVIEETHRHAGNNLGLVHYYLALVAERRAEDPRPVARAGIAHLDAAADRDPTYAFAPNNASVIWRVIAEADVRYGDDPGPSRLAGMAAADAALAINPRYGNALENRANFLLDRARDGYPRDPVAARAWLDEALTLIDRALAINEAAGSYWRARVAAQRLRGRVAVALAESPHAWWHAATEDLARAEALNPRDDGGLMIATQLFLDRAEHEPEGRDRWLREADQRLAALAAGSASDPAVEALWARRASL